MDLQREAKKEDDKIIIIIIIIKKTKLRKNSVFGKLIENSMKECSHLDRPFKEKTNFVIKQLVLKRIM